MLTKKTLDQLQLNPASPERARELGQLGYMQWLGGLPGDADYENEAVMAYLTAMDFIETDATVAVFCDLLRLSLRHRLQPLDLALPKAVRRGGARARRDGL